MLLALIKAETIHTNLKMKSDKCYIFPVSIIKSLKSLKQFHQVIIIMEENMIVIRESKTFHFDFD